jgi:hypothetical protein
VGKKKSSNERKAKEMLKLFGADVTKVGERLVQMVGKAGAESYKCITLTADFIRFDRPSYVMTIQAITGGEFTPFKVILSADGKTGVVYSYDVIPLRERVIYKANGDMLEKFINSFVVKA